MIIVDRFLRKDRPKNCLAGFAPHSSKADKWFSLAYGEIQGGLLPLICRLVEQFSEIIQGMEALAHLDVWEKLFALTSPRPGGIGGRDGLPPPLPRGQRPQIMAAIGGIDIALWDIQGKAVDLPLYRLLGDLRQDLFTYATVYIRH